MALTIELFPRRFNALTLFFSKAKLCHKRVGLISIRTIDDEAKENSVKMEFALFFHRFAFRSLHANRFKVETDVEMWVNEGNCRVHS